MTGSVVANSIYTFILYAVDSSYKGSSMLLLKKAQYPIYVTKCLDGCQRLCWYCPMLYYAGLIVTNIKLQFDTGICQVT